MRSYSEVIDYLESQGVMPDREPSLDRINLALERMKVLPRIRPDRVIVVAGTNGKGTVAKTLETLFLSRGESVGLYTSPHIESTTERIRVNGEAVSESEFVSIFSEVAQLLGDLVLSHFEMLTAMAAYRFFSTNDINYSGGLDWAIFEVGMGGIWDATNAIPHANSVITSLGIDHARFLGNDLVSIAKNKFGIVGRHNRVFYLPFQDPGVRALKESVQRETESVWKESYKYDYSVDYSSAFPKWLLHIGDTIVPLQMQGQRGIVNISLALTIFTDLGFSPTPDTHRALAQMIWPCRMQRVQLNGGLGKSLFLSGDHNPQGMQSLVEIINHYTNTKRIKFVIGLGEGKDVSEVWNILQQVKQEKEFYFTESPFRGMPMEQYGEYLKKSHGNDSKYMALLRRLEEDLEEDEIIVVTGSLYLVSAIYRNCKIPKKTNSLSIFESRNKYDRLELDLH